MNQNQEFGHGHLNDSVLDRKCKSTGACLLFDSRTQSLPRVHMHEYDACVRKKSGQRTVIFSSLFTAEATDRSKYVIQIKTNPTRKEKKRRLS